MYNMRKLIVFLTLLTLSSSVMAQEEKPIPSYFRFDQDYMFGTQLWAGATYPLSDTVGLSMDVYLPENAPMATTDAAGTHLRNSWWSEFDIGPALTFGPLSLTPIAGIAFDWASKRAVALNAPQLYLIVSSSKLYFESWFWTMLYSPFKNPVSSDYIHSRGWLLYKVSKVIGVGPQFEYTYNLNTQGAGTKGVVGAPYPRTCSNLALE